MVIHPLADIAAVLPSTAPANCHAGQFHARGFPPTPATRIFSSGVETSTRQRFGFLRFDFPSAARPSVPFSAPETGCDESLAQRLGTSPPACAALKGDLGRGGQHALVGLCGLSSSATAWTW